MSHMIQKPQKTLLGVLFELLRGVIHHITLLGLIAHRSAEFTGHQCLRHVLLSMLPEKERHLLSLHQYSPHQELIERVGKTPCLWIVYVHNLFLASFFVLISGRLQLKTEGARRQNYFSIYFLNAETDFTGLKEASIFYWSSSLPLVCMAVQS